MYALLTINVIKTCRYGILFALSVLSVWCFYAIMYWDQHVECYGGVLDLLSYKNSKNNTSVNNTHCTVFICVKIVFPCLQIVYFCKLFKVPINIALELTD